MTPDAHSTPNLPDPSTLIARLADGTLAIGNLAGFEVAKIVDELMRRNTELRAERDAMMGLLIVPVPPGYRPGWFVRVQVSPGIDACFDTREEAKAFARKVAGLGDKTEV